MINITTSETFFNKDLNDILKQNNTEFNEYILNSGTLLFKMKDSNNKNFDILNTIGYYQNVIHNLTNKIKLLEDNNAVFLGVGSLSKKVAEDNFVWRVLTFFRLL